MLVNYLGTTKFPTNKFYFLAKPGIIAICRLCPGNSMNQYTTKDRVFSIFNLILSCFIDLHYNRAPPHVFVYRPSLVPNPVSIMPLEHNQFTTNSWYYIHFAISGLWTRPDSRWFYSLDSTLLNHDPNFLLPVAKL